MKFVYGYPLLETPPAPELLTAGAIADLSVLAEEAGFTGAWLTEHPMPSEGFRQAGGHDALDPFVGLAVAATATTTLRLVTYLAVVPYRNPFLLAKSAASLDRLSGGRLELGLGAGYMKAEFRALGVDFDRRNEQFDDAIAATKEAWLGAPMSREGFDYSARNVTSQPTPIQQPHPRIWLGGNSRRTRRRIVAEAQGWMPMPNPRATAHTLRSPPLETIEDLAELLTDLRSKADDAGRVEPIEIMYFLPNVYTVEEMRSHVELARRVRDLGVGWCVMNGQGQSLADARNWITHYHDAVIAPVSAT